MHGELRGDTGNCGEEYRIAGRYIGARRGTVPPRLRTNGAEKCSLLQRIGFCSLGMLYIVGSGAIHATAPGVGGAGITPPAPRNSGPAIRSLVIAPNRIIEIA